MKTIHKYPFILEGSFKLMMPEKSTILTLQLQDSKPYIWALVDTLTPNIARYYAVYGTGHEVPQNAHYVGTWQSGPFVWHLFEVTD